MFARIITSSSCKGCLASDCLRGFVMALAFWLVLLHAPTHATANMHPGFKTMGLWLPETDERMDVAVWYPSIRVPSEFRIYEWTLEVARNGKPVPGRFPLILLSHGTGGSRFSHHDTAGELGANGFVVAGITQPGENIGGASALFTLRQLVQRPRQVSQLLDHLLRDPAMLEMIDPGRIAAVGFGVGGTTALMLAGGIPDGAGWTDYCERASQGDPYCSPWARARLDALRDDLKSLKTLPVLRDTRVRAAVAVAPAYGMLFSRSSMSAVNIPVSIIKAGQDEVNRAPFHADAIRSALTPSPEFAILAEADHFSLMAACPPQLEGILPEVCGGVSPETRERIHMTLNGHLLRFLVTHLGNTPAFFPVEEPQPAPPPTPEVQPAQPETPPAVNATKGKRAKPRPKPRANATLP